jgi:hypothetical protein
VRSQIAEIRLCNVGSLQTQRSVLLNIEIEIIYRFAYNHYKCRGQII